jgi:dUTP pyrophosphatase
MILEYHMMRDDVRPPTRANPSDAGLDIYFSPDAKKKGVFDNGVVVISPGQSVILSTGLKFGVPHGYMLEVKNRSSMAAKYNLLVGACVIDSGYDGEVFINLHNVGSLPRHIRSGDKIAQVVLVPVVHFRAVATSKDNLYDWSPITISDRGTGALGSTDKM